jgi:hypothetical protein
MRLLEVALFRIGRLTLVVFHKVMDLADLFGTIDPTS